MPVRGLRGVARPMPKEKWNRGGLTHPIPDGFGPRGEAWSMPDDVTQGDATSYA